MDCRDSSHGIADVRPHVRVTDVDCDVRLGHRAELLQLAVLQFGLQHQSAEQLDAPVIAAGVAAGFSGMGDIERMPRSCRDGWLSA